MKTNMQAQIIDIQPKILPTELRRTWLSVIGKGFKPETKLALKLGSTRYSIPKSRIRYLDARLIQVNVLISENERHFNIELQQPSIPKPKPISRINKDAKPLSRMLRY